MIGTCYFCLSVKLLIELGVVRLMTFFERLRYGSRLLMVRSLHRRYLWKVPDSLWCNSIRESNMHTALPSPFKVHSASSMSAISNQDSK